MLQIKPVDNKKKTSVRDRNEIEIRHILDENEVGVQMKMMSEQQQQTACQIKPTTYTESMKKKKQRKIK